MQDAVKAEDAEKNVPDACPSSLVRDMTYDPKKHQRLSIRLADYDYAQAGAYFVTICVQDHRYLFGLVEGGQMQSNDAGALVQKVWNELPNHYPGVQTDAFVVMPNHVHAIIILGLVGATPRGCPDRGQSDAEKGRLVGAGPRACPDPMPQSNAETGQPQGVAPTNARTLSLADVVHRFKTLTTKRYIDGVRQQRWRPFPGRLWQRNYYEHIIRNDVALDRIRQYIAENPSRWAWDPDNPSAVNPDATDRWRQ